MHVYIYIYSSKLVLPSSLSRSHETLLGYFSRNNRGEINFSDISPNIFPFLTEEKEGRVIVARFRRIPGCKVSRDVNTIKEKVATAAAK